MDRANYEKMDKEMRTPMEYNGKKYFSVKQFAYMTCKSTQAIYRLMKVGNVIRVLKSEIILSKPYIPAEEYEEFPFAGPGAQGKNNVQIFGNKEPESAN